MQGLSPFDIHARTRLVFGPDTVERLGELVRDAGGRSVLLVTDAGLVAAGHAARVRQILEAAGVQVAIFDAVRENPTTRCVEDCVAAAKLAGSDMLVGLGGGSSLDTAKGCNFLLTNGGRMEDYWGEGRATRPMLPFIAIPTTAGTGSECQSAALIANAETHQKMACLDPKVSACVAILDPVLTLSQPSRVTACAGIDALAHALETAVTTRRNPISAMYSREAFRLLVHGLPRVLESPGDLAARGRTLLGAAFAGIAVENSMLGAAHAAANPLTARHGIPHGHAVGLMLPAVVKFNAVDSAAGQAYAECAAAGWLPTGTDSDWRVARLVERLAGWLDCAGLARSLAECGVPHSAIPLLAAEAAKQWTATFNPRPVGPEEFASFYESVYARGN